FRLVPPRHPILPLFPYTTLFRSFLAEDEARAVAAADAEFHAAVGGQVEGGEQARGNGDVTDGGIGDAGAEANGSRAGGHQREKRSEEHTSELQSLRHLVCRLLLE